MSATGAASQAQPQKRGYVAGFAVAVGDSENRYVPFGFSADDLRAIGPREAATELVSAALAHRIGDPTIARIALFIAVVLLTAATGLGTSDPWLALEVFGISAALAVALGVVDQRRRRFVFHVTLGQDAAHAFAELQQSAILAGRAPLVSFERSASIAHYKYSAGAERHIELSTASIDCAAPPYISANVVPVRIRCGDVSIYIYPHGILVTAGDSYKLLSSDDFALSAVRGSFVWNNRNAPSESRVESHRWHYIRRDGGPDLRFKDNYQVPVLEVGYLQLRYGGEELSVMTGWADETIAVESRCFAYFDAIRSAGSAPSPAARELRQALETLSLDEMPANAAALLVCFPRLALVHHPDRVSDAFPEARTAAGERMKQLNAANDRVAAALVAGVVPAPSSAASSTAVEVPQETRAMRTRELVDRSIPLASAVAFGVAVHFAAVFATGESAPSISIAPTPDALPALPPLAAAPDAGPRPFVQARVPSSCGASTARPPIDRLRADWLSYRCSRRAAAGDDWGSCLARWEYADTDGSGCVGNARCCPPPPEVAPSPYRSMGGGVNDEGDL